MAGVSWENLRGLTPEVPRDICDCQSVMAVHPQSSCPGLHFHHTHVMKAALVLLIFLLSGMHAGLSAGEVRHALVMGAWAYEDPKFPALPGIQSDVDKMAAKLQSLGFTVTVVKNPTLGKAKKAVDDFGALLLTSKGTGLFYFSGHGCENEGKNYLIPIGTAIRTRTDLDDEALSAQRILTRMEDSGAEVNLVFLDCCRNSLTKGSGDLAPMRALGTFIGFATASAKVAGASDNGSAYTEALLEKMATPGVSIMDMHAMVTRRVKELTEGSQVPFQYSGLDVPFALVPGGMAGTSSGIASGSVPEKVVDVRQFEGTTARTWRVAFSPDGANCYAGTHSGQLLCWETSTGRLISQSRHDGPVFAMAVTPDGGRLVSSGNEKFLRSFNARTGKEYAASIATTEGSWDMALGERSGALVVVSAGPGTIVLRDLSSGQMLHERRGDANAYAFPRGSGAFLNGGISSLEMRSVADGSVLHRFPDTGDWIRRVAVSADGRLAASGHGNAGDHAPIPNGDNSVRLWDLRAKALVHRFGPFAHSVFGVSFSPDGRYLLGASLDGSYRLWDTTSHAEVLRVEGRAGFLDAVISPDGRFILTGDVNGAVKLGRIQFREGPAPR